MLTFKYMLSLWIYSCMSTYDINKPNIPAFFLIFALKNVTLTLSRAASMQQ